jgi:hypothetical protein
MTAENESLFKGKSVVYTKYKKLPGFALRTQLNDSFGLAGRSAAYDNGNKIIESNGISDPALKISEMLMEYFVSEYGVDFKRNDKLLLGEKSISDLSELFKDYDYVLDVETKVWGAQNYPFDWDNYYIAHGARVRLIDVAASLVIAEYECSYNSYSKYEDTNEAPSYKSIESGLDLVKELNASVEECYRTVSDKGYKSPYQAF